MATLEEHVNLCVKEVNTLHEAASRTNWAELNREGFVFELEQNTMRLRELYLKFDEINRELRLLMEKNTPDVDTLITEMAREITVLEANISMEKKKKLKSELVNEKEPTEMPELYSSLQQKILTLALKARYNIDKVSNFISARKLPFVRRGSTARNLLDALQQKDNELNEVKQKNIELKRKTYFGLAQEKSIAEIELELNEMDKRLEESVNEAKKSMKTHIAQINYVEGSFAHLKTKIDEIEAMHSAFTHKTIELIKDLKKERDFAKTLALEIENETMHSRQEYTREVLGMEEKKQALEEKMRERFEKELNSMKKQLDEKETALINSHKLISELEKQLKNKKDN